MKVDLHQVSGPCHSLLARFNGAHESDRWAEGKKKLFAGLGLSGLICGGLMTCFGGSAEIGALVAAGVGLLVAGVVLFIVRVRYLAFDLDDRKLATVVQFLRIIQADTRPRDLLRVRIDFRGYEKGGQQTANEKISQGFFSQDIRVKKFFQAWLKVSGLLADGTRYEVEVADHINRKEKPKRKYTKVKEKTASVITIRLKLRQERYGDPGAVSAALAQLQPPPGLTVKSVVHRAQNLSIVLVGDTTVTVKARYGTETPAQGLEVTGNEVLQAMLWAYDGISRGAASRAA